MVGFCVASAATAVQSIGCFLPAVSATLLEELPDFEVVTRYKEDMFLRSKTKEMQIAKST